MEDMSCPWSDISVSPERLDFQVDGGWQFIPPYQYLDLEKSNPVGRAAVWTAVADQYWVTIRPETASAPKQVQIGARSVGMPAGTYHAQITITSHVQVDPSVIPVTLTVKQKEQPPSPEPPPEPEPPPDPDEPGPPPDPGEPEPPPPRPPPDEPEDNCQAVKRILAWLRDRLL